MLGITIPLVLIIIIFFLVKYDRSKETKKIVVTWLSRTIFRDNSGINDSAERLHQVVLGLFFIFCVAIAMLFIIGIYETYVSP